MAIRDDASTNTKVGETADNNCWGGKIVTATNTTASAASKRQSSVPL